MKIRELLNSFADYSNSGGHINFGYRGNRHLRLCMDNEVYAWIRNKYTCVMFSHTTRNQPMCYAVITHDVDLIPFIWVRFRAFRLDWLDGVKMFDKLWNRGDINLNDKYYSQQYLDITSELKDNILYEGYAVAPHLNYDAGWRRGDLSIPDGKHMVVRRRPDGGLLCSKGAPKYHGRGWPASKSYNVDAFTFLQDYENKDKSVLPLPKMPRKLLDELKVQAVSEKL